MLRATLSRAARSPFLKRQMSANPVARRVAARFIAGDDLDAAERVTRELNTTGATVALDYLGENTTSEELARDAAAAYLAALDAIERERLDANISVKLTALGLDVRQELAMEEVAKLAARAKQAGVMLGVDMESHDYVDRTLGAIDLLRQRVDSEGIGVCLQSCLFRTDDDLATLNDWRVPVRLVKGAYLEPPEVAERDKRKVDAAFARQLDVLLEHNPYPMIATHDPTLIERAKRVSGELRRQRDTFEFQMLYGIGRPLQRQLVAEGYRLRVYVPYGNQWYPYFMRRLAERPANLGFFLSSLVRR